MSNSYVIGIAVGIAFGIMFVAFMVKANMLIKANIH